MNTHKLTGLVENCPVLMRTFLGVYPSDMLPTRIPLPCSLIANLDTSEERGSHWVCFYFPNHGLPEYMDSYGMDPLASFEEFMGYDYRCNTHLLQSPLSAVCGQYCLYYLLQRHLKRSMDDVLSNFKDGDYAYNDNLVSRFVDRHFGVRLPMFDFGWQFEQISKSLRARKHNNKKQ